MPALFQAFGMEAQIIAGKYRLVSLLGQGGMGAVWRAEHLDLGAPVAVKLLNPLIAASSDGMNRFLREAEAAAALRSPHVVQILDRGIDEQTNQPFIVMELMEGESLAGRIAREGRLSPEHTARIVTHIARALTRAHEAGIVHRDLKPDNVFLIHNEDEELAKVLDFGIAKSDKHSLTGASGTRTGTMMGTPYYMSPEQISGAKGIDHRADLWALGVIACECLTGQRPFEADSVGGLALKICSQTMIAPSGFAAVPPGFDAWFERAVARDPAARFQSAREAADGLRRVCGVPGAPPDRPLAFGPQQPVQTMSTSALVRTLARVDRTSLPKVLVWAVLGSVSLAAVVAVVLVLWGRSAETAPAADATAKSAATLASLARTPDAKPAPPPPVAPAAAPSLPSEPSAASEPAASASALPAAPSQSAKPAAGPSRAVRIAAKVAPAPAVAVTPKPRPGGLARPSGIGTAINDRK